MAREHDFIERRRASWQRLESLLSTVQKGGLHRLQREEVREFGRLYQRAAADLAIARQEVRDVQLVNYLNHLAVRAHGAIYRTESGSWRKLWHFYRYDAPALFRAHRGYVLAAFLVFAGFALGGGLFVCYDEAFASVIGLSGALEQIKRGHDWTAKINGENQLVASLIMTNNLRVALGAFAFGIFAGLGTFYILAFNGLHIGGILALAVKYSFTPLLVFVCAHGVFELMAIFIAGGAGFLMGGALIAPGDRTRGEALLERGIAAIKLLSLCFPLLVVAGLIEGFLSPANVPGVFKFSVALLCAAFLVIYLAVPASRPLPSDVA
ncbi:stage II sporulation protein M [Chloracidobacterium sp. MS 40/45]|uniref:stage II sporulation protein M n=1 Tax=Chloracidobacterium aggregatum TaxID=2851959 RepID=UPI001B8AA4C3|nr:stage II sporulation protein M [Chloracidobacterium aggregatum]QUW00316.1 stage II sporulation protein M [Chloracidobacterium sp. MS 40/45]